MKKQKARLIRDFYNDKGALHRGEKVTIEGKAGEGFISIITGTGAVFGVRDEIVHKTT